MKGHIMSEFEQSGQDVSPEASSTPAESNVSSSEAKAPVEKEIPFHEHPRFKEVINQKNEFSQRLQEAEKRFQELSSRFESSKPKEATPESKLLERLKGIDPEFGSWAEQQHAMKQQLEQKLTAMEQWKSSLESSQQMSQVTSSLEKLHTENNVPADLRDFYEAQLERAAKANPNLTLQDLPKVYKEIHDRHSKYMESVKRDVLASYTQSKSKDAAIPSASKGNTQKPGNPKFEYSKDPSEARSQIVKNALKGLKS
jgi:exonuclease VII small subunit